MVNSTTPHWLQILLGQKFFSPCMVHEFARKNEKNIFCLDCCISMCLHCLPSHKPHRLLQIRRYVYHDVIRLSDAQKLIDCSLVQPYTTNNAKVVFLKKRTTMSRPFKSHGKFCMKCSRNIKDSYLFCSVSCKVNHTVNGKDEATSVVSHHKPEFEDCQMTIDSVLTWSGSSSGGGSGGDGAVCSGITEFVNKKKCNVNVILVPCRQRCSTINRRKSTVPQRAPFI